MFFPSCLRNSLSSVKKFSRSVFHGNTCMIKIKIHSFVLKTNNKRNESSVLHFARWHLISKVLHFSTPVNVIFGRVLALRPPVCFYCFPSLPQLTLLCSLSFSFFLFSLTCSRYLFLSLPLSLSLWFSLLFLCCFCRGIGGGLAPWLSYISRRLQTLC